MLGKIPDFSQTPPRPSVPAKVVDLAAVTFSPSPALYRAQLTIYLTMLIFSLLALLPFLLAAWYWLVIWIGFSFALFAAAKNARRTKSSAPKQLRVSLQQWRLSCPHGEFLVKLNGEMLLWSWLIIIPVRELLSGKSHYLVALPDSLGREDWRRLSLWLNLCYSKA